MYKYFNPDGIRTRNRPACRQVIYPLDYRLVRFGSVHSILTTVKYRSVSKKKRKDKKKKKKKKKNAI